MSSSVRSRMSPPATSAEDQIDEVVPDEEQRRGAGDEGEADDRDRGTGEHLRDLTPAGAPDEDDARAGQRDRGDVAGEESADALGVDALGFGRSERSLLERRRYLRGDFSGDHR